MDLPDLAPAPVLRLERPGGRIAYTVRGAGPLVVCSAGMGDLRTSFRDLTAELVAAGYRVAEVDLRGHGDSDTTFTEHGDVATAQDLLALVAHLGGPAVLVGNSMSAGAALWAAAESPAEVAGVVLLGPFVRDGAAPGLRAAAQRAAIRFALLRPWGPAAWERAYRAFAVGRDHRTAAERGTDAPVTGRLPAWFDEHVGAVRGALREPARLRSLRDLVAHLRHAVVEARLGEVRAPALVLMGAQDPDFADPAAELAFIESRLAAAGAPVRGVLVAECGHYPQLQRVDVTGPEVAAFLAALPRAGEGWAPTGSARA
jgi:pimeloyl-ACP methyl ester carboxylesterase